MPAAQEITAVVIKLQPPSPTNYCIT